MRPMGLFSHPLSVLHKPHHAHGRGYGHSNNLIIAVDMAMGTTMTIAIVNITSINDHDNYSNKLRNLIVV